MDRLRNSFRAAVLTARKKAILFAEAERDRLLSGGSVERSVTVFVGRCIHSCGIAVDMRLMLPRNLSISPKR